MSSAIAVILIGLGAAFRFVPNLPPNAVPIGALAIFAAARLPKLWAVLVPVLALAISDPAIVLGTKYAYTLLSPSSLMRYAIVAGIALAVAYGPRKMSIPGRCLQGVGAAVVFFLASNFLVWAFPYGLPGEPGVYPHTLAGLVDCYVMGLPFFRNSLAAEVVGVCVLFGLDALVHTVAARSKAGEQAIAS
jgi:hypothetical protein